MQTVLVVDDNVINTGLYERMVARLPDTKAVCETSPVAALSACKAALPDLIVVDYRMPGLNGIEFIQQFRAIPGAAGVPLVMLTSVEHPALWQQAIDAGANAYLTKPVDASKFLSTIARMLLKGLPSEAASPSA